MSGFRRLLLSALVLGLAATQIVFIAPSLASGASRIEGGRPAITLSTAVLPSNLRGMAVGEVRHGSVELQNSGSAGGRYSLRLAGSGSRRLLRQLELTVVSAGEAGVDPVYRGPLARAGSLQLGRIEPGGHRTLTFTLRLHSTGLKAADAALQGQLVVLGLRWATVQA
jgi:hypothetical protein